MKVLKYISIPLLGIYLLMLVFFLLDSLTGFEIKSQSLRSFVYIGLMIGSPIILLWNIFVKNSQPLKFIGIVIPIIFIIITFLIGPLKILFASNSWKTQTILYQNGQLSFKKIEYQMQDIGALGYNDRTVEVLYLTDWFMIVSDVPIDIKKRIDWTRVDIEVNELGIKYP